MVTLIEIVGTMAKTDTEGNVYWKTLAIDEDGTELWGWSSEPHTYLAGDKVERFFHKEQAKMRKPKKEAL